jgi:hypothetical protein
MNVPKYHVVAPVKYVCNYHVLALVKYVCKYHVLASIKCVWKYLFLTTYCRSKNENIKKYIQALESSCWTSCWKLVVGKLAVVTIHPPINKGSGG